MKIDSFSPSTDLQSREVDRTRQAPNDAQERTRLQQPQSDSAAISSLGAQVAQALAGESPGEIGRVEQTQQAVSSGSFSVPAAEVAESLIDSALEETAFEGQASAAE